jgi:predicted DNA-binding protein (MmcQ/YjbR family)
MAPPKKPKKAATKKAKRPKAGSSKQVLALAERLHKYALSMPEAWEDFPWGDRVAKVRKKVFAFVGTASDDSFNMTTKLPFSAEMALGLPFTQPTGYGLGKAGWVSSRIEGDALPPEAMLRAWIEESYRAVAPKKLAAAVEQSDPFSKLR